MHTYIRQIERLPQLLLGCFVAAGRGHVPSVVPGVAQHTPTWHGMATTNNTATQKPEHNKNSSNENSRNHTHMAAPGTQQHHHQQQQQQQVQQQSARHAPCPASSGDGEKSVQFLCKGLPRATIVSQGGPKHARDVWVLLEIVTVTGDACTGVTEAAERLSRQTAPDTATCHRLHTTERTPHTTQC